VKEYEIKEMKKAFATIYKQANQAMPRLTYVIVQKRHHFRSMLEQNGQTFNPPPGSVINTDITDKDTKNFYLYSHHALQVTICVEIMSD
jgi:hypothetical protein